ncbi:lysylphosphatidylglycerol synthase domain-containing protein [Gaetbulibacter saemankumensis]|uniref:lysylphosphatidylglycerol synthase domain-containing protein n=1 Tax=Gaetbulibacter saemankumensis TaxID=311208 RepID=UPI000402A3E7|nr:lysylphosphatidylglycerol synthase domain-containing protein [Gaetbulibacter saemankumensis]
MTESLPYKTKQFFLVLIKISLVITAFYYIYEKLNTSYLDLSFLFNRIENHLISFFLIGLSLLILTSLNWFFDILKWQHLVSSIKHLTLTEVSKQCLASLTVSIFTPNKIGEYGAKALFFSREYRKQILILNLISNLTQMSITLILGVIGLSFFSLKYSIQLNFHNHIVGFILLIMIALLIIITFKRTNYSKFKLIKLDNLFKHYNTKQRLLRILVLSLIRYLIFSFQFYYLLHLFNVDIYYFDAMVIISSMYLLSSIIPSIAIFDVAIKGSIAAFLFSYLSISPTIILSITTIMWIFNFVLPTLIGSHFVLNYKYPNSTI